jgi:catechol 2,3-dioxygenase-like lactoylglutathione lyase family enzyme
MRTVITSVLVDDQTKALAFYTDVLGFTLKSEVPLGEHRWLTVVSPEDPEGPQVLLEPDQHPAAQAFKTALMDDGIPARQFTVDDVESEFRRLSAAGVRFTQEPLTMGPVTTAVFDDTCGNLIQLATMPKE